MARPRGYRHGRRHEPADPGRRTLAAKSPAVFAASPASVVAVALLDWGRRLARDLMVPEPRHRSARPRLAPRATRVRAGPTRLQILLFALAPGPGPRRARPPCTEGAIPACP